MRGRRRRWLVLALIASACVSAGCSARSAHARASIAGTITYLTLPSAAIQGPLSFAVYAPAGYATSGERYPVVYFLHGLPAGPTAYRSRIMFMARHLESIGAQAIAVVAQTARPGDTDPEYFDWGAGRNWQTALSVELPRYVDAHYRTIAARQGRAIVGISAGGYGATITGLLNPEEYSVIESWSGYFVARNIRGDAALDLGEDSQNLRGSAYAVVSALRGVFARLPTFFGFYVGRGDTLFYASNRTYDAVLRLLDVPHTFAVYPGKHNEALWNAHADAWLRLAVGHLAAAK